MNERYTSERGQALILLVIAFVVLLGFVALAIDGGMVYSDRRYDQNASDASSLAGGGVAALSLENQHVYYTGWNCSDARITTARSEAVAAAIARASSNNFSIDGDVADYNGVMTTCGEYDNGSWVDKYLDITAQISTTTDANFAQFVFSGALINQVEAVTRVRPRSPLAFGYAIVSTADSCPNQNQGGITFDGGGSSQNVHVNGGGIFSNSCITANGGVDVVVEPPDPIRYVDDYTNNGSGSISPAPEEGPIELPDFTVPPPDCASLPSRSNPSMNGDATISPGQYAQIKRTNDTLTMEPGLYCVTGDFDVNGDALIGSDVTIYIISGDFSVGAQALVQLDAPPPSCSSPICPPAIAGLLIYLPATNDGEVSMRGNAQSFFEGLVYVPSGTIEVGGGASEMPTVNTQLIAWTVKIHGNVSVDINFNGNETYNRPSSLELYK